MLFALQNLSFSFGARPMLSQANLQVGDNERIGLVGPNGAGKSTLLRLIMGEYIPDGGTIQKANDTTLGFFNQDLLSFSSDSSILEVGMGAFEEAKKWEKKYEKIAEELEQKPDNEDLLMAYSEALHQFEIYGGYEMEHRTAEVLEGLGFSTTDLSRPYNQFSGGWRMRVLLAKLMLQQPKVLLLDEPTNHLDLPSIEWLEKYLQSYPGSVIIVSHDRYFLDKMVTRIVELFQQQLHSYSGGYSFFEEEKSLRLEFLEREYENQQKYIKQQERFVERFKAKASKAAQAQSIVKRLDKLDRIELPDADVPRMNINFEVGTQPGKIICQLKNVSKSYGDLHILKNADAEISRGDKIALVGANGKGKSTLLRIIADAEKFEGTREGWHNVMPSFYAQHQLESLNIEKEILEELKLSGSGKNDLELRQLLGCFLFSGDDVFKKIKVLSGGEKARVALAKVIAGKANFLLLDEPTNHLDIQSVELLIEALNRYQGTLIFVSHDRYFVSKTANKYWEIEDGKVLEFKGPYEEYVLWKEKRNAAKLLATQTPKVAEPVKNIPVEKPKNENKGTKEQQRELQRLQKQCTQLENKIAENKKQLTQLETLLGDPATYSDSQKYTATEKEYQALQGEHQKLQTQYDAAFEEIMTLEEALN